jgi:heterodisulfide reductase subunit A
MEIVNAREQCAWVHQNEPDKATKKILRLVRGAIERVKRLEEIKKISVPVENKVLVIGGGIAGIQTAVNIASFGYEVYIVERSSTFGGHVSQLATVFPTMDCGLCISPLPLEYHRKCMVRSRLMKHPNINAIPLSEVINFEGIPGNFKVTINKNPRYVDEEKCDACGICEEVCPVEVPDEFNLGLSKRRAIYLPYPQSVPNTYVIDMANCTRCRKCVEVCPSKAINLEEKPEKIEINVGIIILATGFDEFKPIGLYNYGKLKNIITQLEFARILDPSGPTGGKVIRPSDGKTVRRLLMIQCVGSRDPKINITCSKICCMIALNHSRVLALRSPETRVIICYKDIRLLGKDYETYYEECVKQGVRFIPGEVVDVREVQNGDLHIKIKTITGEELEFEADLIVLSCALLPSKGTKELAEKLKIRLGADGHYAELPPRLVSCETSAPGVLMCGCATTPIDIPKSIQTSMAASARAITLIRSGKIEIYQDKAVVNKDICIRCGTCLAVCPYSAVVLDEDKVPKVVDILCRGCGICNSECPKNAIQLRNYTDDQIASQLDGLLLDVV